MDQGTHIQYLDKKTLKRLTMKQPKNVSEIKSAIAELEQQQKMQLEMLKQNASETYENLKPANLLRSTLESTISSPSVKRIILNNAAGLATGYITQRLIIKNKDTFVTKLLGTLVNLLVAHAVAHNADTIKKWGEQFIEFIGKAKKQVQEIASHDKDTTMPLDPG